MADTGIGIEPDVLPLLFHPFEQGDREMNRSFGGLGLGLAVSKSLIEAHEGTLTAPGARAGVRGAVFTVELPLVSKSS